MSKVNYQLITIAREIEGYTQKELSDAIGVEQGTLSKIENGLLEKTANEIVDKVADVLGYPIGFFLQDWNPIRIEGHYRRKVSESVKDFKENRAKMTLAEHHFAILTEHIELPKANYPIWDLTEDGSPSLCAKFLRDFWRVPKGKINNVTEILEENGFVIIELELGQMDGFSCFSSLGTPLIFINKNLSGDRYRMTVTHEAIHFIVHHGQKIAPDRIVEDEAFECASEFLIPLADIEHQFNRLTLSKLIDLKTYWKVSIQAILYKAGKSELITPNQSKYLWKQIAIAGYKKKEPVDIPREQPSVLREIFDTHFEDFKYSIDEVNKILNFNKVQEWYLNKVSRFKVLKRIA